MYAKGNISFISVQAAGEGFLTQALLSILTSVTFLIALGGQAVSSLHDLRVTSVLTDK